MSAAPDSEAWEGQTVHVSATVERDQPKYGSVSILLHTSETLSTTVRITRATAEELQKQLADHLTWCTACMEDQQDDPDHDTLCAGCRRYQ